MISPASVPMGQVRTSFTLPSLIILFAVSVDMVQSDDYFPPPESHGGWRTLDSSEEIRRLGGMEPRKLKAKAMKNVTIRLIAEGLLP